MDVWEILREVAERQGPIYKESGVFVRVSLCPEGFLIETRLVDHENRRWELSQKLSWFQLRNAADTKGLINDTIDRSVYQIQESKEEFHRESSSGSGRDKTPYRARPRVPVWERGDGCLGPGSS